MATHTVIQDIEAEDKFLGPLTLKQFIFGAAGIFFAYLNVFAITRGATFLMVIFVPPALLGFFLAIPWSKEQSTEVWVLAKIRFRLKPKVRIWNQSGMEELVTITAPKKIDKHLTNGLDQTEVQSRLKALAETIDTRGWAVKHATFNDVYHPVSPQDSQRLVNIDDMPQEVPEVDVRQYDDVLDDDTAVSENFNNMIETSSQVRRQESLDKMDRVRNGEPLETVRQPEVHFTPPIEPYAGTNASYEENLSRQVHDKRNAGDLANSNMRTLPDNSNIAGPPAGLPEQPQAQMTNDPEPDIINWSRNNDLTVDTIARNVKKDQEENEVVVPLR